MTTHENLDEQQNSRAAALTAALACYQTQNSEPLEEELIRAAEYIFSGQHPALTGQPTDPTEQPAEQTFDGGSPGTYGTGRTTSPGGYTGRLATPEDDHGHGIVATSPDIGTASRAGKHADA